MFDIGFWELVVVGIVALLVVGPDRLPGLARTSGRWLGKVRRLVDSVRADIERDLYLEDAKRATKQRRGASLDTVKAGPVLHASGQVKAHTDPRHPPSSKRRVRRARGRPAKTPPSDAPT